MTATYKKMSETEIRFQKDLGDDRFEIGLIRLVGDSWQNAAGETVDIEALVVAEKTPEEIEAETAADAAVQASAAKLAGTELAGVMVSLTEENQNGIASVLTGANLAAEVGAPIFPLNFNAVTAAGVKSITFDTLADFKAFALAFMAARQKFFQ